MQVRRFLYPTKYMNTLTLRRAFLPAVSLAFQLAPRMPNRCTPAVADWKVGGTADSKVCATVLKAGAEGA